MAELIVALFLGFVLLASILWLKWFQQRGPSPPVPPGSLGLPFIGETLQYLQAVRSNKLSEFLETREKRYGPVFKTSLFGYPIVVVNPPRGLKLLFSNHGKLVESAWPSPLRPLIGEHSLFFMEGDKAKSFRHILAGFLGPDAMQRYVARTSRIIDKHLSDCWQRKSEVRAYTLVKEALFSVVFELFLGLDEEEGKKELLDPFLRVLEGLIELPIDLPGTYFHKAKKGRRKIMWVLDRLIKQKRLKLEAGNCDSHQDLLSVLLTRRDEEGKLMSEEEIKDNVLMLVLAGHDTSASSMAAAIKCIAENPWCFEELVNEHKAILASKQAGEPLLWNDVRQMKFTWRVVQEGMRLIPAAQGNLRRAITDFEMDGYTIPKGWQLLWSVFRSNKKEEFFDNPNKFDPRRFEDGRLMPYTFTPFGGGPRICPGAELAKMQDLVFLHHLLTRFKWELVDPDEHVLMAPLAKPVKGLPIKLTESRIQC